MSKREASADKRSGWDFKTLLGIFVAVIVIWFIVGLAPLFLLAWFKETFKPWFSNVTLQNMGTFGDTFGAANSLFSALGVAGVAYALILQFREQRDARIETIESRKHDSELAMLTAQINAHAALLHHSAFLLSKMIDLEYKAGEKSVKLQESFDRNQNKMLEFLGIYEKEIIRLIELAKSKMAETGESSQS